MASSFSRASATSLLKKYDVFISFRGEDTRVGFTSHLHASLCRSYLQTYIDYRIQKGNHVWEELVKAIKQSTLFLVVFSDDYASSTWCLNELVEIMDCHKDEQHDVVVIPVFYDIDPSQVRKQTGSFATAIAKHKKQHEDKIQKWKDVLSQAANLSGFHSSTFQTEADMIEEITRFVLGKLDHTYENELASDFILNENYWSIESLLKVDSAGVQVIGLWGMGGIGKTTLAEAIFHKFSFQYEGSCFFKNVTEESKRHGINYIYNKLLSELLREDLHIGSPKVMPFAVMRRLKHMKAFIVLDDVRSLELLQNLTGVGYCWLGAGSRVIVTTRDKHVLISGRVHQVHQVKQMNSQNSLQLFSLNAFDKALPEEGYEELSKRAIDYAKGNPLGLKILGSVLRGTSKIEWNCALAKLKEIPNKEIDLILRWSYNDVDDKEKHIFLDFALFFIGHKRDGILKILNSCGFFADIGIRHLLDKALIRVDLNKCIQMHDLIREMGKQIVREESLENPGQRSRLCDPKEIYDVLKNDRGTEKVEAIFLDATECTHISLSPKAFEKMPKLRLLAILDHKEIKSISLPSGLDLLPENLRYFLWDGYPWKSLPRIFCPEMLVQFSLRDSHVEKLWNGVLNLPNLEILDVSYSLKLIECPNVSGLPNLKEVVLSGCVSLPEVDSSIFLLQKLERLFMIECTSLKTLTSNTCSPALLDFAATYCINLREFSVAFASVDCLLLGLPEWDANELPSSILHFKNLKIFTCPISDSLVDLPENFAICIWLVSDGMLKGERDTSITLRKVIPSPAFLSVKVLIIDHVSILSEIPDNIFLLSSLESLSLIGIAIRSLPETIEYLPRLKHLDVFNCNMLQSIPVLSQFIPYFIVWNCESLEKVLSSTNEPSDRPKHGFMLLNCIKLDQHSYQTVLKDAIAGIELGARQNAENEDPSLDHDDDIIEYFLPAMSGMKNWSRYPSSQVSFTLELPPSLLGFAYYLVLSQGNVGSCVNFGCECYWDNSSGERFHRTSFTRADFSSMFYTSNDPSIYMMLDHLVLWYDPASCKQIMEAVEERKATSDVNNTSYNPKLTFRFFIDETLYSEVMIVECGFHWIYPFETNAVPNRNDGFDSDGQEDTVPLTNKLEQCVVGTPSSLDVDESEEMRTESDLIEEISRVIILGKLNHNYKNELTSNFILDENYWSIESSIKIDSAEVQVIGLWGMGGIGKTTLAAAIFHEFSFQYESSCFLVNVTEESKRHGIIYTCSKLLSKLLGEDDLDIGTSKVIPSVVMRRLKRMKVFIVLDDVHSLELLENLIGVGYGWLGAGSRVIVTTRNKHVLISGGVHQIHQVKEMNSQNSLQLFSLNAFDKFFPEEGYMDLSKRAIDYVKGNPLALKVLGSYLRCKVEIEWNSALDKLKEIPNTRIDLILRRSYNELDDDEKNIFLDIALFFKGYKRDMITEILNGCGFYAEIGITSLLDKALIRVDFENCIQMHDLLQEMGKQIVHEESPKNPGQRSRLCDPKEVCDVLKNDRGTEMVEVIFLDTTECRHLNVSPKVFEKMPNLRILIFLDKSIRFPSGLDLLPENLRCFSWDGYPCKSLPPIYSFEMLVEFSMRHSHVEKLWNGEQSFPNLERLDLGYSKKLIECPNLAGSPNLKYVTLNGCESLLEVDSSIFLLPKLEILHMRECKSLKTLSSNTCSPTLHELDARNCINLQEFSVSFASGDRLNLFLPECGANGLPSSILHLQNLERFIYPLSDSLVNLPENFANSIWLVFENLPKDEPDTSITLNKLFPSPAFMSVKELIIDRNDMLSEIPYNISLLSSLESLSLIGIAIRSLPESIKYLPRLEYLEIIDCDMLESIPSLSQFIPYFFVWECGSLEKVLSSPNGPSDKPYHGFMFLNCTELDSHSYQTVLNDAIVGIDLGARLNSENGDPSLDHDNDIIEYFLPAMSGMESWFRYHSTQASFTLELPPNLLGFAYYLVLSQGNVGDGVDFGCECCLDNSSGERIYITSSKRAKFSGICFYDDDPLMNLMSDNLVLWYDPAKCKQIIEAVEEIKAINDVNNTSYNPKLTFRFSIDESRYNEVKIVECGFHWRYPFEGSAVPNKNDDLESDDQEDTVPPTNKLEQRVVATLSSLEVDESEDLSYSLVRLLDSMESSWSGEKKISSDLERHNK
ncbi:unnamed protein product [Lathyrus oleraceus]